MEEKRLTDEEIVKALDFCTVYEDCEECEYDDIAGCRSFLMRNALELIHRLKNENESLKKQIEELSKPRKKILANKVYSDSTLKKWKKEDLIEHIRILEHNWSCAEENLNNSVKNSEKIFYEQKAEIERLTRELDYTVSMNEMYIKEVEQNAELQKQVDELKEQAVKDTAKEILDDLRNIFIEQSSYGCDTNQHIGYYDYEIKLGLVVEQIDEYAKEKYGIEYGVEVE